VKEINTIIALSF